MALQEEIAKAVREEIAKAARNLSGEGILQDEITKAVREEMAKATSDLRGERTLQREKGKTTSDFTEERAVQEEIFKALREERGKATSDNTGERTLQEVISAATSELAGERTLQREIAKATGDLAGERRLHRKISNVARNVTEKRGKLSFFKLPRIRKVRPQVILEFLKWLLFWTGLVGILVSDRFLSWIGNINPSWLRNILEIFSYKIGNLPIATIFFFGILILACVFATLQKRTEDNSRARSEEATSLLSELATDLGKGSKTVYVGKEVLNELGEVKKMLSELSLDVEKMKKSRPKSSRQKK